MQRVTVTIDDKLSVELDAFMKARCYQNRSEALRDLARAGLQSLDASQTDSQERENFAILAYLYDHELRALPQRLTHMHHHSSNLSVATLHVHVDARHCLEVTVLKGPAAELRHFSDHIMVERGVYHGQLTILPTMAAEPEARTDNDDAQETAPHKR